MVNQNGESRYDLVGQLLASSLADVDLGVEVGGHLKISKIKQRN